MDRSIYGFLMDSIVRIKQILQVPAHEYKGIVLNCGSTRHSFLEVEIYQPITTATCMELSRLNGLELLILILVQPH